MYSAGAKGQNATSPTGVTVLYCCSNQLYSDIIQTSILMYVRKVYFLNGLSLKTYLTPGLITAVSWLV